MRLLVWPARLAEPSCPAQSPDPGSFSRIGEPGLGSSTDAGASLLRTTGRVPPHVPLNDSILDVVPLGSQPEVAQLVAVLDVAPVSDYLTSGDRTVRQFPDQSVDPMSPVAVGTSSVPVVEVAIRPAEAPVLVANASREDSIERVPLHAGEFNRIGCG